MDKSSSLDNKSIEKNKNIISMLNDTDGYLLTNEAPAVNESVKCDVEGLI